jgi:hypothetical protein
MGWGRMSGGVVLGALEKSRFPLPFSLSMTYGPYR